MSAKNDRLSPWMLASLGVIGMLGPFGTDTYTPALPEMSRDLHVSMPLVQFTLAAFTVGMAIGQFVAGSLSDRFGRRVVLVSGSALVGVAALMAALSPNVYVLIALCTVMGLASAGGITGGRAVVADLTHGTQATRPFAILGMISSLGPILGPIGGAIVLSMTGQWRDIFIALAVFAAIGVVGAWFLVPETLAYENRHRGGLKVVLDNVGKILSNRQYLTHALILWFAFGLMFAYISTSSLIVQENLGLPPGAYAASFATNGCGLVLTSFLTARLAIRIGPRKLLFMGLCIQLAAILGLLVLFITDSVRPWPVFVVLFFLVIAMGFVFGPVTALAMVEVRFAAGTAVALLGGIQFAAAAISATLVGVVSTNAFVSLLLVAGSAEVLILGTLAVSAILARRNVESIT